MTSKLKGGPMGIFTEREMDLIHNSRGYAQNNPAGLPGHNLMIIIAKLVDITDVMILSLSDEGVEVVTKRAARIRGRFAHSNDPDKNPNQSLFEQIDLLVGGRNMHIVNMVSPRRTAKQIAKSQNRSIIYICPDDTYRNPNGDIIGKKGDSLHGTPYAECIPFSFASLNDFGDWLDSVIENKEKHNEDRQD